MNNLDSRRSFIRNAGVLWFGIPMGIFGGLRGYTRDFGMSWHMFYSLWFWFCIIIGLIFGIVGGIGFGRTMWWLMGKDAYLHKDK